MAVSERENALRMERERKIVRRLLSAMNRAGWRCLQVDDGGDETVPARTLREAFETIFSVDESRPYFTKKTDDGPVTHWVYLVAGNDCDIISDWSYSHEGDEFDAIVSAVTDYAETLEAQ